VMDAPAKEYEYPPKDTAFVCQLPQCNERSSLIALLGAEDRGSSFFVRCAKGHTATVFVPDDGR
jgi:hypothetical protein